MVLQVMSVHQGIGTTVPEKYRRRRGAEGGTQFFPRGGPLNGEGTKIFRGRLHHGGHNGLIASSKQIYDLYK